jgi:hypothetical protein
VRSETPLQQGGAFCSIFVEGELIKPERKKNMKGLKILLFMILITSLIFGVTGCGKKKEEARKVQTIANSPLSDGAFKVKISIENPPTSIKVNSSTHIKVKVKNISPVVWPSKGRRDGNYKINLAYHWLDVGDRVVILDGVRASLPYDIHPDEEVILDTLVAAPNEAGEYILEWDMVQEGVSWFKDKGGKTARIPMKIE